MSRVADDRRRFAARAWARRRAAARPAIVAAAVCAGAVLVGWILLGSGAFGVRNVTVVGTHRLTADDVVAALGTVRGEPLLRVDTGALESRVGALPGVRHVTVHRSWPGTLKVAVVERAAIATVHKRDGWWLVDAAGVEFGPPSARAPSLRELWLPAVNTRAAARSAVRVLSSLPANLLRDVTRIEAASASTVQLRLRGGAIVVWGSADRSAEKARILQTLLARKAKVYDVSSPSVVTTR